MHRLVALLNAVIFFLFWLIALYAGADHPPPPGFVAVLLLDLAAAALVYWRVPVYWTWFAMQGSRALPWVVRDELLAGLLFAAVATRPAPVVAIWFAVVGSVGVVNAVGIYLVNWAVAHTNARL